MALYVLGLDSTAKQNKRLTWATTSIVNVDAAAEGAGSSEEIARADHKHSVTVATPTGVGTANAAGSSDSLVRADHVHAKYYTLSSLNGTGLSLSGTTTPVLAIDTGSTVDFSSATPVWTFGNETTAEGLFVTGTPVDANHVVNKTYVDNAVTGIVWKDPAIVLTLVGNAACATINGLSPTAGDAYVVTDASTITSGSISTAIGDIVEYNGTIWVRLENGAGGFVPAGTRAIISTTTAVISPYSTSTDEGKIVDFTGASNTGVDTGDAVDGNALLLQDAGHVGYHDNEGYVFEGTVPTGSWILFTGAGTINAGAGLTKSGNTLNVGAGTGIAVGADTVAVDVTASLNITGDWNFGTGAGILGLPTAASTTEGDIWYNTTSDSIQFYDASGARTLWDDSELAASSAQYSTLVADAANGWVEDTGFKITSGAVTTGSWTATAVAAGYGGTGLDTSGSTGVATVSAGTWFIASSLSATLGGTGLTTFTDVGRILYSSSSTALTALQAGTAGTVLTSGGVGSPPTWTATAIVPASSTQYSVLVGNASTGWVEDASFKVQSGAVKLGAWESTTKVGAVYGGTGISTGSSTGVPYIIGGTWATETNLDELRGGTGNGSYAAGDILYASSTNTLSKLAKGTDGEVLTLVSGLPSWTNSSAEVTASDADQTGSSGVTANRLVVYLTSTGGYTHADGTAIATSVVAGVALETQASTTDIDVAYNGRVPIALAATTAEIFKGDKLYLAQESGGYVVPAAQISYTGDYVQLPVAIALEGKAANAGGNILAVFNPVGLHAVVL